MKTDDGFDWYDVQEWGVEGRAFDDVAVYYDRLPARAEGVVREVVWNLSRSATGMIARFDTDSPTIKARWQLRFPMLNEANFPRAGFSGLDLYVQDDGRWRFAGATMKFDSQDAEDVFVEGMHPFNRACLVNLPLRNGIQTLQIGVVSGSSFTPVAPRQEKPILYYGTSIVHGAYASRPGMVHPAIIGRRLNRPMLNLGFSGNAQMEPEVAKLLAEKDPCLFVVDALPNMNAAMLDERCEPFMRTLLDAHPKTPMIMIEDRSFSQAWIRPERLAHHAASRQSFRRVFDLLRDEGHAVTYVTGDDLFGLDSEGSPDGSHPTDLGYMRMADKLEPIFRRVLEG